MSRIGREEQNLFVALSVIEKIKRSGGGGCRFADSTFASEEKVFR
jgi:hypothetical protein